MLKDIENKGYYLFGEKKVEDMKFKKGEVDNWPIATIVIRKKDNVEIMKVNPNK